MSSTFALPTNYLSNVRLPRLRRRAASPDERTSPDTLVADSMTVDASAVATVTTAARESEWIDRRDDEPAAAVPGMPFLRTPDSWTIVGRPVSYLDHVAVSPNAVLAVTTRRYVATDGDAHVERSWKDIRTAKGAAKLLALTLDDDSVEVRPVLMLWGPGAPELEKGYLLVKGVWVLDPARPELWSHLFETAVLDEVTQRRVAKSLRCLQTNSNDTPIALAE